MNKLIPTEHQIQNAIIDYLEDRGHIVTRINSGMVKVTNKYGNQHLMKLGAAGTSDLLVCENGTGIFWAIEVKRPGGKTTERQDFFLQRVKNAGGKSVVVSSLEEVQKLL